jgi:predicted nucleic acid-binding protein
VAEVSRAVLDTSVLVAADVRALEGELAVSVASLAELHFGALVTDDTQVRAEHLRQLTLIEHPFTPLPVVANEAQAGNRAGLRLRGPHPVLDLRFLVERQGTW